MVPGGRRGTSDFLGGMVVRAGELAFADHTSLWLALAGISLESIPDQGRTLKAQSDCRAP